MSILHHKIRKLNTTIFYLNAYAYKRIVLQITHTINCRSHSVYGYTSRLIIKIKHCISNPIYTYTLLSEKSDKTLDPTIFYSYDITSPHKKCIPLP